MMIIWDRFVRRYKNTHQKINYHDYIKGPVWRLRHKEFLALSGYRCPVTLRRIGKGRRYNCHHTNYKRLGQEIKFFDVIPLSPFAHTHIAHGILSLYKRPSKQKHYPNVPQRIFHNYCRIVLILLYFARMLFKFK